MKVIDLLNEMASDVSYKPTFLFRGSIYKYNAETKYYEPSFMGLYKIFMILNDEVEIIEEIEKVIIEYDNKEEQCKLTYMNSCYELSPQEVIMLDKIEELRLALNYLLKKEEK